MTALTSKWSWDIQVIYLSGVFLRMEKIKVLRVEEINNPDMIMILIVVKGNG